MQREPELPNYPIDWGGLIEEFKALTLSRFGKRARKINELLGSAHHSAAGIQATLKEIAQLTITFVDPVAIDDLVYEMEQRLAARAGIEPPLRRGQAPWWVWATDDLPYTD